MCRIIMIWGIVVSTFCVNRLASANEWLLDDFESGKSKVIRNTSTPRCWTSIAVLPDTGKSGSKGLEVTFDGGKKIWGGTWTLREPSELQTIKFGGRILVDVFVPDTKQNERLQLGLAFQEMSPTKPTTWQQQWTWIRDPGSWQTIELPFKRALHKEATIRIQFGFSTQGEHSHSVRYDNLRFEPRPEDSDNDGLEDAWEQEHFSTLLYNGNDDVDRDHFPNAYEAIAGTKPTQSDSDGDGLQDGFEWITAATDPLAIDSDEDGLTDRQELEETHSNPNQRDSDHDQLADGAELQFGTNPSVIDTDGDGFSDYHEWAAKTDGVSASSYPQRHGIASITEFMAANVRTLADDDGEFSDWIEIGNLSPDPVDLSGYALINKRKKKRGWQLPQHVLAPDEQVIIFASGKDRREPGSKFHCDFKLGASGEYLALLDRETQEPLSSFGRKYPKQRDDVSFGRSNRETGFLAAPTPGKTNTAVVAGFLGKPQFSHDRGYYTEPFDLTITARDGAVIRYTTDASIPSLSNGHLYGSPIQLSRTTIVRVGVFKDGYYSAPVTTQSYLFPADVAKQPAMNASLASHPRYGPMLINALQAIPAVSLVFKEEIQKERQVLVSAEFIPTNGTPGFEINCGCKRVGGASLKLPKNIMRLYFKSEFGPSKLVYPFFEGLGYATKRVDTFDQLTLHSGAHDSLRFGGAQYVRNRWIQDVAMKMKQPGLRGRWVHLYLNGSYHGHYEALERPSQYFFASYYGNKKADYDVLSSMEPIGSSLRTTYETNKALRNDWPQVSELFDMNNLIDFMLLNFYAGNDRDWGSGHNWVTGGPRDPKLGQHRFISWDADWALREPEVNNLYKQATNGLFHQLLQHEPFRALLQERIQSHFFGDGALTPANAWEMFDKRRAEIGQSLLAEAARWGRGNWFPDQQWKQETERLRDDFFPKRTEIVLQQFQKIGWLPPAQ